MKALARPAWQAPARWPEPAAASPADHARARRPLQAAVVFAMLCLTVFDRFGLRTDPTYSAHPALLATYVLLATMLVSGAAEVNLRSASRYVAAIAAGGLSWLVNWNFGATPVVSIASLMLLLVLYAPFVLSLKPAASAPELWGWVANTYLAFMLLVAIAGIGQFLVQFAIRPPWLFDFTYLIPSPIRGFETWVGVHQVGGWFKSNGFFLREPSFFSLQMGVALVLELSLGRRKWVMAILALGLLLSYSGSGLLVLAAGLAFPLGWRSIARAAVAALIAAAIFIGLGDTLNLAYTVERSGELLSNRSSAYCRFVHPVEVTLQNLDAYAWTPLLGHGPGTLFKMHGTCETTYAKLPFEYGMLGTLALGLLVFSALARSTAPLRLRAALAAQWLTQPQLLGPESVLPMYLLCAMWPRSRR